MEQLAAAIALAVGPDDAEPKRAVPILPKTPSSTDLSSAPLQSASATAAERRARNNLAALRSRHRKSESFKQTLAENARLRAECESLLPQLQALRQENERLRRHQAGDAPRAASDDAAAQGRR